jgi:hypothetical protein
MAAQGRAASVQRVWGAVRTIVQGTMRADRGVSKQARKAAKEVGQGRLEQRSAGSNKGVQARTKECGEREGRGTARGKLSGKANKQTSELISSRGKQEW